MKRSLLLTHLVVSCALFCLSEYSLAAWDGCEQKVNELLSGQRDQFILRENHNLFDQFQLANCDGDLAVTLMVAIHEGVHFIDLNVKSPTQIKIKPEALFMTDMSRLPFPQLKLPSPYQVFEKHGAYRAHIQKLKQSKIIVEYKEYVLDRETHSSHNIISGFSTEFNAYCHGTLSSHSLLPFTKELELLKANPEYYGPLITQRTGLMAFIGLSLAYFDILKTKFPTEWSRILANSSAVTFYNKLLTQGLETLKITSHCDSISSVEKAYAEGIWPLVNEDILKTFKISIGPQEIMRLAICQ